MPSMQLISIEKFKKLSSARKPKQQYSEKEEYLIKVQEFSMRYNWNVHNTNMFVKGMSDIYGFSKKDLRNEAMRRANKPELTFIQKLLVKLGFSRGH